MGLFFPLLGNLFAWGSLGIIGLMVFAFVGTMLGFIGGGIIFALIGRGNYDVWSGWWILISGTFFVWGLIRFVTSF